MTKKEFDLKYRGNKAIHCDTEEKANKFLKLAHSFGYVWFMHDNLTVGNYYFIYQEKTCYTLDDISGVMLYCDKDYYKKRGYTIIEFELDEPNGYAIEDTPSPIKETTKESNMKYKVGDKVRVRSGLVVDSYYGGCRFANDMKKLKGKVVTIALILEDLNRYKMEESQFYWSDEMLEPTKETFKVGDIVYEEGGQRLEVIGFGVKVRAKNCIEFYRPQEKLYKTKPLRKITQEELAEMGYELGD